MAFLGDKYVSPNFEKGETVGNFNVFKSNPNLETYHEEGLYFHQKKIMSLRKGFYDVPGKMVGCQRALVVNNFNSHVG